MKTLSILLLSFVFFQVTGNAQSFTPIAGSGFNYDVIANGSGSAAQSVNHTLIPNLCFYAHDFQSSLNPDPAPLGLPANGNITSSYRPEINYQLRDYQLTNAIIVGVDNDHETFYFNNPTAYSTLALLMTNNYPSSMCVEVNFEDNTRLFYNFNNKAWDNTLNAAYKGCGMVNINNNDQYTGTTDNYNLFDYLLAIPDTAAVKNIVSVRFSKSDIGSMLYVLALSGSNQSPYSGYAPTPVLEGMVKVDTSVRYMDTGGEYFCYANGTTHRVTFIPADPTKKIKLNFNTFQTYCVQDVMRIYNSKESTDGTKLIAQYSLTINRDQKELIATNPDGALTCVFTTNDFFPHIGWDAAVTQITLNETDLKALSLVTSTSTPPMDEAIPFYVKIRNYSTTAVKGTDYQVRLLDSDNNQLGIASGIDIEPGFIDSVAVKATIATAISIKGEIIYDADQNLTDNQTSLVALSPMPQIKMGNGTISISNETYNFYDEGGIAYNYSNGSNNTLTIQPNSENKAVRVRFTQFKTELNFDFLSIYNSASVSPSTLIGKFSGSDNKIPSQLTEIVADNDNGALTFVFTSDPYVSMTGWLALIDLMDLTPPVTETLPTVTTQACTAITSTSAMANGTLSDIGNPEATAAGFCYSHTTTLPTTNDGIVILSAIATGNMSTTLTNLDAGTVYYVRAFATNSVGTVYGEAVQLNTLIVTSSVNQIDMENGDGSTTFEITANTSWSITSDVDWLTFDTNSGDGNATITITSLANTSIDARNANITISAEGVSDQVIMVNQGAGTAIVQTNIAQLDLDANTQSTQFEIQSNTSWTITSDADWLSVDISSGNGNATITITSLDNPTTDSRNANITISAEGVSDQVITVNQGAGTATLNISNNHFVFEAIGGSETIEITSNTTWSILANNNDWIEINVLKSTSSNQITLTVSPNSSTAQRDAELTVETTDGGTSQVITIQQAGAILTNINAPQGNINMVIYPNPCSDGFQITNVLIGEWVTIISLSGQVVWTQKINTTAYIDTSSLSPGIYIVKIGNMTERLAIH